MSNYHIYGRPNAGSLIVEFLFRELKVDYAITFVDYETSKKPEFIKKSPMGKIPVLECPDGTIIFETLAIISHIVSKFPGLTPQLNSAGYDAYVKYMSIMATSVYTAYHRQNHGYYYISKAGFEDLSIRAREEQSIVYDYFESILNPYFCNEIITAADFYFFMLCKWDSNKADIFVNRPKINNLFNSIKSRASVIDTYASHPE